MSAIPRILDANLNRAREALRVMEDAARFALNDGILCGELKSMRHALRASVECLPPGWLEVNRDTAEDVGTQITATSEMKRAGLLDIVIASGKRLTEALRVIEELLKTIDVTAAARIKSLRYRAYEIDAQLQTRFGAGRASQWKLCLILTRSLCKRPWEDVLRAAINGGTDCVQIREKTLDGGELAPLVQQVIRIARPAGVSVIVNDRPDIALAANADGVHVGQSDMAVRDIRRIAGRRLLVGVSTHDLNEAQHAIDAGADYCGVGMIFDSTLKPDRTPSGLAYLRAFREQFPSASHLAIGGITSANIYQIVDAGARGVAVSTAICAADDPQTVAHEISTAIDSHTLAATSSQS